MILCKKHKLSKKPRNFVINYIIKQKIDNDEIDIEQYHILNDLFFPKNLEVNQGFFKLP